RWARAEIGEARQKWGGRGPDSLSQVRIVDGTGNARAELWKPRHIRFRVKTPSTAVAEVRQYYYPLWSATLDDESSVALQPSTPFGLLRLTVPPVTPTIDLRLEQSTPQH